MLLVRDTSTGRLALEISQTGVPGLGKGLWVNAYLLDDDGWSRQIANWWEREEDENGSLADALVAGAGLPPDEAEQFVATALVEWRERGGDHEISKEDRRGASRAIATMIFVAGLAVSAVIAGLVWLLLKLL